MVILISPINSDRVETFNIYILIVTTFNEHIEEF